MTLTLKTVAQEYLLRLQDGVLTGGHVREEDIVVDDITGIVIARGESVLTDLSAPRLLAWSKLIKATYAPPETVLPPVAPVVAEVPEVPVAPIDGGAIAIDIINEPEVPVAPEVPEPAIISEPCLVPEPPSAPAEPVSAPEAEQNATDIPKPTEEILVPQPLETVALETPSEVIASLPAETVVEHADLNGQFAPQGANPDVQDSSGVIPAPAQVNIVYPADGSDLPHVVTVDPVQGTDPELRVPPETVPVEPDPVHTEEVPAAAEAESIAAEAEIIQEALAAEEAEVARRTTKGKK